jgi:hypothetical protein
LWKNFFFKLDPALDGAAAHYMRCRSFSALAFSPRGRTIFPSGLLRALTNGVRDGDAL